MSKMKLVWRGVLAASLVLVAANLFSAGGATAGGAVSKGMPPVAGYTMGPRMAAAAGTACGACYFYVGGQQYGMTATGAAVTLSQTKPVVAAGDFHSLDELAVESADGQQIVEVGSTVDPGLNGDLVPHLFVYHWVNGQATCYNACGFVNAAGATIHPGSKLAVGTTGRFKINYASGRWNVSYNGSVIGYFPGSLWGGKFTKAGLVQPFGEVAAGNDAPATQMGDAILGSKPGSAVISNFTLINANAPAHLTVYDLASPTAYNYGSVTATGLHFGGPGY